MLAAIFHSPNIYLEEKIFRKVKMASLIKVTGCAVCGSDERVLETDIK